MSKYRPEKIENNVPEFGDKIIFANSNKTRSLFLTLDYETQSQKQAKQTSSTKVGSKTWVQGWRTNLF